MKSIFRNPFMILGALGLIVVAVGCKPTNPMAIPESNATTHETTAREVTVAKASRSWAQQAGTVFAEFEPTEPRTLRVRSIGIPDFPGTFAIWGSSGWDDLGNILLGVSTVWTSEAPQPSARVYRYTPAAQQLELIGDVVGQLKQLGINREESLELGPGGEILPFGTGGTPTLCKECQMKVHSRFVTMDDGWTYFASMDEWDEREDGSRLPHWGSHLWRYSASAEKWEKIHSVPEALIAVSGVGRYLFAVGYFGHVLYRFDTQTDQWLRTEVGSSGGHITRNILSDARGHAFVPRVSRIEPATDSKLNYSVELVEFDENLTEVCVTPLKHYSVTPDSDSHGITAISYLADRALVFTTADGFLYHIVPDGKASKVVELGWIHPAGKSYAASLFPLDGKRYLCGVTKKDAAGFEWYTYDMERKASVVQPFVISDIPAHGMKNVLLYGSNTRGPNGQFYLVGCYQTQDGSRQFPLCLEVEF